MHNDCRAMEDIAERKHGEAEKDDVRDRTAMKYSAQNTDDLCKENLTVQQKSLTGIVASLSPNTRVVADSLDVLHVHQPKGERKAGIILDSPDRPHTNYSQLASILQADTNNVYFIQYTGKDDMLPDLNIVPKISRVSDITIFSTDKTCAKATELYDKINRQAYAPNINLKFVELVQQLAQQHKVKLKL